MDARRKRKELIVAGALIGLGVLALPYAIYAVGSRIVGDYAGGGAFSLALAIWAALGRGEWAAWLLVLSPYCIVQLARLTLRIARSRSPVTPITD